MDLKYGYAGKILEVDLSNRKFSSDEEDPPTMRKYLGGMGLGAKLLYDNVPPEAGWSDPDNHLIIAAGPMSGTRVMGSGTACVVTIGAMNEGTTSTQANGYFGAYIKFCGYDAVVIKGRAERLSYIYIREDGQVEFRDAHHLAGKDSWETEELIKEELGFQPQGMSVLTIGPSGENRVRFSAIFGDRGHVAAHNGPGAVMGSKNLKAIAVARGKNRPRVYDDRKLSAISKETLASIKDGQTFTLGTLWIMKRNCQNARAPFLNYTTSVNPMTEKQFNTFFADFLKKKLDFVKRNPCWACPSDHCHLIKIPEGTYAGQVGELPEYEGFAAMGSQLGIWDGIAATALSIEVDRLGMDVNETGWLLGMVMECYQKGLLTKQDTNGLEMTWGNVAAVRGMIYQIAHRQGLGDILAEGGMRATKKIGGEAPDFAIHTMSGNTPRTHDHRNIWPYIMDNCTSNTGSTEANVTTDPARLGIDGPSEPFAHREIATFVAKIKGHLPLMDSLVLCTFVNRSQPETLANMLQAVTGWNVTGEEMMDVGRRAVNLLRAANNRRGYTPALEMPSPRYGAKVTDGPNAGKDIAPVWPEMLDIFYREMGWDRATGKPLPETLTKLELDYVIPDLWPDK